MGETAKGEYSEEREQRGNPEQERAKGRNNNSWNNIQQTNAGGKARMNLCHLLYFLRLHRGSDSHANDFQFTCDVPQSDP